MLAGRVYNRPQRVRRRKHHLPRGNLGRRERLACRTARPRPIYHYVLLWQNETDWAEADWQAATDYIARFRPTVGFSVQEAARAAHVTIIGGESGISLQTEEELRAAGCSVQRLAGKNPKETRRLLDALAREGRRFPASEIR